MIVLDEQLKNANVKEKISQWYRGPVVNITSLRPDTLIKDDGIPVLLRQVSDPIFVTINTRDFWERTPASRKYCVICFPLTDDRVGEISDLLRRLFRLPEFKTKQVRRGKVARVSHRQIQYYQVHSRQVCVLVWPEQ